MVRERFELILEVSSEGFWDWDLKTDRAYLSPRYCELVGYSPEDTVFDSKFFNSIIHPDDRAHVFKTIEEHMLGKSKTSVIEYRMISKNGDTRWIEGRGKIVEYDEQGAPARMVGTITDITKRKQIDEHVYFEVSKLPGLVVARFDRNLRHEYVSPPIEGITGIRPENFIGKSNRELGMPAKLLDQWEDAIRAVFDSGLTNQLEFDYSSPDGQRYFTSYITPVHSDDGSIISVICITRDITELKKAVESLKQSEERFRSIVEESPIMSMIHVDGKFVYLNPAAVLAFRIDDQQEYIGKPIIEVVHPDFRPLVLERVKKITNDNQTNLKTEEQLLRKDGSSFWVEVTGINSTYEGVKAVHVIAVDITDRKLAEIANTRLVLCQQAILDNLPMMAWLKDKESQLVMVNEPYAKACGISIEKCIGKTDLDLFPPEMAQKYMADDMEVCITGLQKRTEEQITSEDGLKWHLTYKTPVFNERGNIIGTTGIAQDITERKTAEIAINTANKLLQTIIDTVPMRIFWKDAELYYLGCNRIFASDAGVLQPSELIGKDDFLLAWKEQAELYREDDRHVIESGVAKISFEEPQTTPDGNQIWIRTSKVPLRNEHDEIIGVLGVYDDITQWKRAEEEKQLFEQQMQHTQKLESLGVLAGGIAHDFNNILAIIMGYCSLTKMAFETAEKNITEIEKAVERAAALCRQMLAYAGKAPLEIDQVDICMVVTEMSKMLQSTIAQNVEIKPVLSANVPCIIGDASQIRQVVMNLIINAAEAIGDKQGEVRVSLSKKIFNKDAAEKDYLGKIIPHGGYACLEVADTGGGMSDETYNRVFEPFYTTKFSGRGLGMSAVLGIIKTHNGALQLSSELGKGTTFKIYLPVQIGDCTGEEPLQQVASAPWQGSGTILLVEDEVQLLLVARTMLEALGFTVIEASNGKEGLELFQKNAADIKLVVTDMGMPVMDGYQLFSELRSLRPDLPIIISSGFGDTVVESRITSEDIAGSISKPYSFDRLRDVLKMVIEGQNQA